MSLPILQPITDAVSQLKPILEPVYGDDCLAQAKRYETGIDRFRKLYGSGTIHIFRAPGRINLIGGHTDYNHGYVMPVALDRDLVLFARPREDRLIRLSNVEQEFADVEFEMSTNIPRLEDSRWSNYVRGAAQMIVRLAPARYKGMDCLIMGEAPTGVPRGSGLSSSSALTVAATIALSHFSEYQCEQNAFVQVCSDAEWYVGTRGGIMDQFISIGARRNHALFLDCRPAPSGIYTTSHVPMPEAYEIVIAESGVRHDNVRGEYNRRVASCRTGVQLLKSLKPTATHLRDFESTAWSELEPRLPQALTVAEALEKGSPIDDIPGLEMDDVLPVRTCCRHVWQENKRVVQAYQSLKANDVPQAGRLISQAHASARDNYGISFSEMETLIEAAASVPGVLGGRITGAGWGGCAVFLAKRESVTELQEIIAARFQDVYGVTPPVYPCRSGTAAGMVTSISL